MTKLKDNTIQQFLNEEDILGRYKCKIKAGW